MIFTIRMGQPLVFSLWNSFNDRFSSNSLKPSELIFFKKWTKALQHLQSNPHYPGLHSHEISALSRRTGFPIFESYVENNNSTAYRMYWFYGYGKKRNSYLRNYSASRKPKKRLLRSCFSFVKIGKKKVRFVLSCAFCALPVGYTARILDVIFSWISTVRALKKSLVI